VNLNPGDYTLECSLAGFNTLSVSASVSVGKATSVQARMTAAKPNQEVVVKAQAPLIETRSVQTSINYSEILIEKVPTMRNVQDLMDAAPAINDNGAYGAGARVRDDYYKGSGANAYLLNGVDISDAATGATWVNPNYDSIEEIQVVGIGASAEYGNFSGAVLNVITKTGSNAVHGGLSSYFANKSFYGDNSGGILDLKPQIVKVNSESSAYVGGPLIKEKLFFLRGYMLSNHVRVRTSSGSLKQPRFGRASAGPQS
jgi:outer membrane receptor for ferrienterochelin and colicin